jgi:hypothetical protein
VRPQLGEKGYQRDPESLTQENKTVRAPGLSQGWSVLFPSTTTDALA